MVMTKIALLGEVRPGTVFKHPGSGKVYMKVLPLQQGSFGIKVINLETGREDDVFGPEQRIEVMGVGVELSPSDTEYVAMIKELGLNEKSS